jgi:hypothetical protein
MLLAGAFSLLMPLGRAAEAVYISPASINYRSREMPLHTAEEVRNVVRALRDMGVRRIYWRGFQEEYLLRHAFFRKENLPLHAYWAWVRELADERRIHAAALDEARELGMEVWGVWGLFDLGSDSREDAYCGAAAGFGPSVFEDTLRVDHPDKVPEDRFGIRRQAGTICLEDSRVRGTLVNRLMGILNEGYSGLLVYTYSETLSLDFIGEFDGGERQLTAGGVKAFFVEMAAAAKAAKKSLALQIDARPAFRDGPSPWLGLTPDVNTVGDVALDWRGWLKSGIIQEVVISGPSDSEDKGRSLARDLMKEWPTARVHRLSREGLPSEGDENVVVDVRAAGFRSLFHQAATNYPALRDWCGAETNSLDKCGSSAAVVEWFRENAGNPPLAADVLACVVRRFNVYPVREQLAEALQKSGIAGRTVITELIASKDDDVRRIGYQAASGNAAIALQSWVETALSDPDPQIRWIAARALAGYPDPDERDRLIAAVIHDDPHPTVRSAAAWAVRAGSQPSAGVVAGLQQHFRDLHRAASPPWEAIPVGHALVRSGPRGVEFLRSLLASPGKASLADSAWRALYLPQDGSKLALTDPRLAQSYRRKHPAAQNSK